MELVFSFICVYLTFVKVIYGQENSNSCEVLKTESCIHEIKISITSDLKVFYVFYKNSTGNNETIAVCDWLGKNFSCDTKTGINHNAVSRTTHSFIPESSVPCLDGSSSLKANGQGYFTCNEKSDKSKQEQSGSESNTNNKEQTTPDCQGKRESANDTNKHREKRSAPGNCNQNTHQKDTPEKSVNVVAIGIGIAVILVAVGVVVAVVVIVWRKRSAFKRRKIQYHAATNVA